MPMVVVCPVRRLASLVVIGIVLLSGCTQSGADRPGRAAPNHGAAPVLGLKEKKTIRMAFEVFPSSPAGKLKGGGRGNVALHWIYNGYLTGLDRTGTPELMLAADQPSLQNGSWRVNPDQTMETVWTIRPAARWHDGHPITSRDFQLSWRVINDPLVPVSGRVVESLISDVIPIDDRTFVLKWRELYTGANEIAGDTLPPLPAHLLEGLYDADKQAFLEAPYWTTEFVGAGPFKVDLWDPANGVIVTSAHEGFALGRPAVDELRMEFITDLQTMLTNIMAGAIDVAVSPAIDTHGAIVLTENWERQGAGRVFYSPGLLAVMNLQLRDLPNAQRALKDKQVRQALAYAIDKQAVVDITPPGVQTPAYYPLALTDPLYPVVDRTVRKYEFNPGMAEQLLTGAGWQRSGDGIRLRGTGERLDVPILASPGENETVATIVADYWHRIGVDGSVDLLTAARALDSEFQSSFRGAGYTSLIPQWQRVDWVTSQIPAAATRWAGRNRGGYASPETDVLVSRVQTTLNPQERERYAMELLAIWADDAAFMPMLYKPAIIAAAMNIAGYDTQVWPAQNAHTWNLYRWTKD
jgi:peptide/nickel transport system substrate-binding protein